MTEQTKQTVVGLSPGAKIGKYVVVERMAIGGQAIVYKCHDPLLDRHVAIKQISSHLAEDPKFMERFRREAQILARLGSDQQAVVTVHELIEDERGLFIVMEFVPGVTIEQSLCDHPEPVDPKAVLAIVWRLAAGLNAVHAAGIIHRDIKPANIIIGEGLRAKIADFGVAASVTGQTSMVLGTTKYMAPEVFGGQLPDARMDMYSLGFVAYEMLVGRAKFNEIFADIVRDRHCEAQRWMKWHGNPQVQAPPAYQVNPNVPVQLSELVAKMIAKDPAKRFQSMEELGRTIKTTFSPRARQAAAPEHKAASRSRSGVHAAIPAAPPAMRADDADELMLTQGPQTAELPKKKMPTRTKLVIAGGALAAVLMGVVALIVVSHFQAANEQESMSRILTSGEAYYKEGNWVEADKVLGKLLENHKNTQNLPLNRAHVLWHLSREHIAIDKASAVGDVASRMPIWDQAASEEHEVEAALETCERISPGEGVDWTKRMRGDFERIKKERLGTRQFVEAMDLARSQLAGGKYDDAQNTLDAKARGDLTRPQDQQLKAMTDRIHMAKVKASVEAPLTKAKAAVEANDFATADTELNNAQQALKSPEATGTLSGADQKDFRDQIDATRKKLGTDSEYAAAVKAFDAAKTAGKTDEQLRWAVKMAQLRPSPAAQALVKELQADLALKQARKAKDDGKTEEARTLYKQSLDYRDDPAVRAELAAMDQAAGRVGLVKQGDQAMKAEDWTGALKIFKDAQNLTATDDVAGKIAECEFQILIAEGDALAAKKDYPAAIAKYQEALKKKPSGGDVVDAKLKLMARDQEFEKQVKEGDAAFEAKQWSKARDAYQKALKVRKSDDVAKKINLAYYTENLDLGRSAMDTKQYGSALGYFRIAQAKMDTPEIRKLIADADRLSKE